MTGDARRWKADLRPPLDPAPGDRIGDYRLEKKLGQGATGAVHKAWALRGPLRGKVIAIKIIQRAHLNNENRKRRVNCEITLHRELARHPAIVRFEHSFEDDEHIYILTEYCPGSTLFQYTLDSHPTGLPEDEVRPIFLALVQAVSYLHLNRILHRDLKLTNVLLTDTMKIRIADFGLATKFEDATQDQEMTMCGTPNYISPEIVRRSPYGVASDVWSLGCMLVALVTGRPPFQGDQVSETLHLVSKGAYRPLPRSCSREVKNLVETILQTDPQRRPTTAEILAHPFLANSQVPISKKSRATTMSTNASKSFRAPVDKHSPRSPLRRDQRPRDSSGRQQAQLRQPHEPVIQARKNVFDFGASVSDKVRNPWSRTQSSVYEDLVRDLRQDVRMTSREGKSKGHRLRSDGSGLARSANGSSISAESHSSEEAESDDNYKKHRQEVPSKHNNIAGIGNESLPQLELRSRPLDRRELMTYSEHLYRHMEHGDSRKWHTRQSSDPSHARPRSSDLERRLSCGSDKIIHHYYGTQSSANATSGRSRLPIMQTSVQSDQAESKADSVSEHTIQDTKPRRLLVERTAEPLGRLQTVTYKDAPSRSEAISNGFLSTKMTRFSNHARPVEEVPMLVHNQQLVHDIVDQDEASDRKNDETTPNVLLRVSSSESEVTSDDPVTRYKFNTADLKPVSQNNKHGQVAILEDGSVSVLLKKDGRQHLVSSDGELITTTDRNGVHKSFTLEDLPARSLLAYRYASKFVTLARNKTVRIALDSDMAKCRLYQSDTFEVVLLKQQRKLSFEPNARTIKIADHDEVLWKGTLDNVAFAHRELVRQALIWWARCKEALDEPVSEVETQAADHGPIEGDRKLDPVVKFIDGLGWCEKHDEGRLWTMYFLDGLSLEVCTKTRRLYVVKSDESKEEYKLEAGLPVDIRQRLKSISRAMKHFV